MSEWLTKTDTASRWRQDTEVAELIEYFEQDKFVDVKNKREAWSIVTPQEVGMIQKELIRCRADFVYAARNYFWISTKSLEDQLFSLWPAQELILEKILELKAKGQPQKLIIIKSRQLGCSSLIEALVAWRTMFFQNVNALVCSYDDQHSGEVLFPIMTFIYDRLPWWLQPEVASRKYNKGIFFENPNIEARGVDPGLNSRVFVKGANAITGIGQGIRLSAVHLSEFCDFEEGRCKKIIDEDMGNALVEGPGTFAILESTAKGANTYAHRMWKKNVERAEEAEWHPLFLPWFFETSHVRPLQINFKLDETDLKTRDRVENDWVRCNSEDCLQYHYRFLKNLDRSEDVCPTCKIGLLKPYLLTDNQLCWMQHRRLNAEKDDESRKLLLQEQCIAGDHRISTPSGFIPIREAATVKAVETGEVSAWYPKGKQRVVRVKTHNGRELICTPDHKLEISDGWVEAQDSTGKDLVLSVPIFAERICELVWNYAPKVALSIIVDEDWARFLGYFAGDGCCTSDGVTFACDRKDQDVVHDLMLLTKKIIGSDAKVRIHRGMTTVVSNNVKWLNVLKAVGVVDRYTNNSWGYKRRVCVPECIWRSPKHIVKQFLSALFESRTAFFSKHADFNRDIQLLLLGFGINSKISRSEKTAGDGHKYIGSEMRLNAVASNIFNEKIGFISQRKRSGCHRPPRYTTKGHEMKDLVVAVEEAGETDVYDITVPGPHSFGAHGISVKNCGTAEESFQISGYQMFPDSALEWATLNVRDPIAIGRFDRNGQFHGYKTNEKPREDGSRKCPCVGCDADHQWDDLPLRIWRWPEPGQNYCVGADVAEGLGGDAHYSVGACISYNLVGGGDEQVAVWRSNTTDPIEYAAQLNHLGRMYNEALMAVECNRYDICLGTLRTVFNYNNLYRWKHIDSMQILSQKLGWWTNLASRPRLWQTFRRWLQSHLFFVRSRNLVEEMKNFVKDEEDATMAGGDNAMPDDEAVAVMIALFTAHEGDWNDALGYIPTRTSVADAATDYEMKCRGCQHTWAAVTPGDYNRCPECGSRMLEASRKIDPTVPQPQNPGYDLIDTDFKSELDKLWGREAPEPVYEEL